MSDWKVIHEGFKKCFSTERATIQVLYFPESMINDVGVLHIGTIAVLNINPKNGAEGTTVAEKIRFKPRSTGPVKEATTIYDIVGCFYEYDEDHVVNESADWDIDTIELDTEIYSDANPSKNDLKIFEFLEKHILTIDYEEELQGAQEDEFFLEPVYDEV